MPDSIIAYSGEKKNSVFTTIKRKRSDDLMAEAEKEQSKKKASKKKKSGKKIARIHFLDELRGIALFCMVFYHAFYSIGVFFKIQWGMDLLNFFMPAEPYFAALFIFISGISSNLSHSNLRRGVKLALVSIAVTLVTYLALGESQMIVFGILHMLAVCMIVYGLIGSYLKVIPMWVGVLFNVLLFVFTYNIAARTVGIPFALTLDVPAEWYSTKFLFMFGLPYKGFYSSDYFPLLPWFFMFFAGVFFGRLASAKKFPKFTYKKHLGFFAFLGRHSLIVYLAHQPVIFGICYGIQWLIGLFTQSS